MIQIKNIYGDVIYTSQNAASIKEAVEEAVKNGADLIGAILSGADLIGAKLRCADLSGTRF